MTEPFDPFEILEDLNPIDAASLRGAASSPAAQATLESILQQPASPAPKMPHARPERITPRRRRIYAVAAIALAVAMAGTAWALTRGTQKITVGCYAATSTTARTIVLPADTTSPVQTCRRAWQRGDFGTPRTPPLQACVLPSGAVGVFPGKHACEQLKLSPLAAPAPSGRSGKQGSPVDLRNMLVRAYLGRRCLSRSAGLHLARSQIRNLNLAGWNVRITTPFTNRRNCTSYAFDELNKLVLIVPMPPR
jgi:hypothetical protein